MNDLVLDVPRHGPGQRAHPGRVLGIGVGVRPQPGAEDGDDLAGLGITGHCRPACIGLRGFEARRWRSSHLSHRRWLRCERSEPRNHASKAGTPPLRSRHGRPTRPRPLPTRRQGGRRHRRLQRAGRRVRPGAGRGRRRRRARRAPGGPARRHRGAGRADRPPGAHPRHRRLRPAVVHRPGGAGHGGVRPRRRPGQQRRHRYGGAGHPRDARAVPPGHRRQPQRLLLDGPGLRPGDAAGLEHHQHQLGARAHHRRPPPGGVRLVEGGADRADPRPGPAVDRPQGHPGQRDRARASSSPR